MSLVSYDPSSRWTLPPWKDEAEVFFPTKGANADVSQVRVEGYYNQSNVGALIPSDLPRSTLLYVLTASEGRDLIFKSVQYSLQLIICFLKTPALFSPEMLPIADSLALRFWKNYNTIRHGRSLFKLGRGLINLFTLHDVCEKLLMKYGGGCHRRLRAVRLRVLSRCLPLLRLIGREDLGEDDYILKDGSTIGGPRFSLNARVLHHRRDVDSLVQDEMYCHTAQVEGYVPQPGNNSTFGRASDTETPTTPSVPFLSSRSRRRVV
ncbi:hypothetical protein AGDE_15472 [Angomonas deanei]|uniref:Uncharacterized protein n=1 Tax=Angomonas deanei TaxID=59799 RepID=A0A7G2CU66_9TRYP|nr:hypothetical protein AGDE_15472 [Angomonas deanei]CAD2222611.1 hypothetical protein, conserved [Angomonas deanei]|eukprot:EPY19026.1 hypothetical protein AGDE_15472 [Angomonas deanei]